MEFDLEMEIQNVQEYEQQLQETELQLQEYKQRLLEAQARDQQRLEAEERESELLETIDDFAADNEIGIIGGAGEPTARFLMASLADNSEETTAETTQEASGSSAKDMSISDAGITAVFGYAVVFAGLVILMIVLYCTGAIFKAKDAKASAAKETEEKQKAKNAPSDSSVPEKPVAPGSAGHVKIFDVPDKEAAMIMAIVADKMQKPLNELHFISIKEVK